MKKEDIIKKLKEVIDPHLGENIYDLGLVRRISTGEGGVVEITFKPTSPSCPMIPFFINEIERTVNKVKGVKKVKIKID